MKPLSFFGNIKKNKFSFGISPDLHYLCNVEQ